MKQAGTELYQDQVQLGLLAEAELMVAGEIQIWKRTKGPYIQIMFH